MADYIYQQHQFADAVRNTSSRPPCGVTDEQMQVYRELCRNNVFQFIDTAFPVCREVIDASLWSMWKAGFFENASPQSPFFRDIAHQFSVWVTVRNDVPHWFADLSRYELAELRADIAEDNCEYVPCPDAPFSESNAVEWLHQQAVVSATADAHLYRFAVHEISADNPNPAEQITPLVVFRDPQDQIRFLVLNPLSFSLLEILKNNHLSLADAIAQCLNQHDLMSANAVSAAVSQVHSWWVQGLIRQLRSV